MNIIDFFEKSILHNAIDYGKLSLETTESITIMYMNEKVDSIHKYAITAPKDISGRYMTYIINDDGKRVKLVAPSKKELYKKLYSHYFDDNAYTIEKLYPAWIEKRKRSGLDSKTIRRNQNHWDRYYSGSDIVKIPLSKLSPDCIEDFLHSRIIEYDMTIRELTNMKIILSDILKMAKRAKFISYNPFDDVVINKGACRPETKHNNNSRYYTAEEKQKLFLQIQHENAEHPEITDCYAILLLFKFGLRIGEMVALKWSDIDFDNNLIHVHRMETDEDDGTGKLRMTIVEHTKKKSKHGDRFIPFGNYEREIFDKIRSINKKYNYDCNDFIFCDEKGRTNIRSIDSRLRKLCRYSGIEEKSAHDIRRTVASELFEKGVPITAIRDFLGHSDTKTTYGYIYNTLGISETNNLIVQALSSNAI